MTKEHAALLDAVRAQQRADLEWRKVLEVDLYGGPPTRRAEGKLAEADVELHNAMRAFCRAEGEG